MAKKKKDLVERSGKDRREKSADRREGDQEAFQELAEPYGFKEERVSDDRRSEKDRRSD